MVDLGWMPWKYFIPLRIKIVIRWRHIKARIYKIIPSLLAKCVYFSVWWQRQQFDGGGGGAHLVGVVSPHRFVENTTILICFCQVFSLNILNSVHLNVFCLCLCVFCIYFPFFLFLLSHVWYNAVLFVKNNLFFS